MPEKRVSFDFFIDTSQAAKKLKPSHFDSLNSLSYEQWTAQYNKLEMLKSQVIYYYYKKRWCCVDCVNKLGSKSDAGKERVGMDGGRTCRHESVTNFDDRGKSSTTLLRGKLKYKTACVCRIIGMLLVPTNSSLYSTTLM